MCLRIKTRSSKASVPGRDVRPTAQALGNVPVKIDIEDLEESVSTLSVSVASDRVEEVRHDDVSPDDRVERPLLGTDGATERGRQRTVEPKAADKASQNEPPFRGR